MTTALRTRLYVNGQWVDGDGRLPVTDPATEAVIAEVATASVGQCLDAVAAAQAAMAAWQDAAPRERGECLRRAFEMLIAERDDFARLITTENGKTFAEARGEVAYAAEFFRWFAEEAVRITGDVRRAPAGDKRIVVLRQPVGVSLLITPWNFPAAMATRKIGPALAAGCTVILKPAPETPLTALALADLLARAGVPNGVVNVVLPEPPAEAVRAMLATGVVRKLSFTGSTEVGSTLMSEAAATVTRCSLELGGNAPFIVFEDADVDVAIEAALVAKLRNTGASCVAANRLYVHEAVYEPFAAGFGAAMAARRVGPGVAADSEVGALVSREERDKVADIVDDAVDAGGRLLVGGSGWAGPGAFHVPTVLTDVAPDARILAREVFGPVAPVVKFGGTDDVVGLANDVKAGLIAYVMTGDVGRALRVAEAIEVGMVAVNRGLISDPAAPFGGTKASGLGREGGFEGIDEYLEVKYIGLDW